MVVIEAQSSSPSPPCLVELPLLRQMTLEICHKYVLHMRQKGSPYLVNMSTALEFRLLTALGNLCMEALMEAGGSSSESTEVWLANLLDN